MLHIAADDRFAEDTTMFDMLLDVPQPFQIDTTDSTDVKDGTRCYRVFEYRQHTKQVVLRCPWQIGQWPAISRAGFHELSVQYDLILVE